MKIENHLLKKDGTAEKIVQNPSNNAQYNIVPKYLVIHYTAGDNAFSAIDWFKTKQNEGNPDRICAHIVIDVDGTITQLVPFNRRANHAGYSNWNGTESLNNHSIGIEIVNPGFCEKMPDNTYRRFIGKDKSGKKIYKTYPASTSSKIMKATHKHKFWKDADNFHWFKFPAAQLDAVYALSKLLITNYSLIAAVGHDDISPARKPDPGPMFFWDEFQLKVYGRLDNVGKIFIVDSSDGIASLRVNHDSSSLEIKKLTNGFEVGLIETFGMWHKVYLVNSKSDVVAADGSSIKKIGWVHSSLLILK